MITEPEDLACGNYEQRVRVGCNVELTRGRFRGMTGVLVGYSRGLNGLIRLDGVQSGVLLAVDPASVRQRTPDVSDKSIKPAAAKTPPHRSDHDFTAG
jgi:hypothetical protein